MASSSERGLAQATVALAQIREGGSRSSESESRWARPALTRASLSSIWARAHSSEHHPRRSGRRRARVSAALTHSLQLAVAQTGEGGARSSEPLPRSAMVARASVVKQEGGDGASHQQELTSNEKEKPRRCR
ncbi:hypothetical protein NL676_010853 [Syzygium grande]|nr:hypothetical protein NL676_010853 [Syzygium grande]